MKDDDCKDWKVIHNDRGTSMLFYCAGCDMQHVVHLTEPGYPSWSFNGDNEKPTFEPSILVSWDQRSKENRMARDLFKAQVGREPTMDELPYDVHNVCHSFVRDGMIQYLSDCTHRLANNTLPLLTYDNWFNQDA